MTSGIENPESDERVNQTSEANPSDRESQQNEHHRVPIHPFADEFRHYRETQDGYEKGRAFREKLTLAILILALLVYGGQLLTYRGQLAAMRSELDILRRSAVTDQRAWIALDIEPRTTFTVFTQTRSVNLKLKVSNTGKTPAKQVLLKFDIQAIPNGLSPTFKFSGSTLTVTIGVLSPAESDENSQTFYYRGKHFQRISFGENVLHHVRTG